MKAIPFNKPSIVANEVEYIEDAIKRGQLSGDGFHTNKCVDILRTITGSQHVLLTHSCTAALEMAAILCDLQIGDEVIMPSFTFVSTANAVALRGAVPVFVDIDPETLNIDPKRVAEAIGPKTKAIFAVHYAGFPADMDALTEIAQNSGCLLIEDAAQALGSAYKERPAGSLGDMAAFSFHETKNVISGEGGSLTVNRAELYERAEIIREKGTNRSKFFRGDVDKYTWIDIGSSFLPGELVAAYLHAQLQLADTIKKRRLEIFDRYTQAFSPLAERGRVRPPRVPTNCKGNGHMFYLLLNDLDDREAFIAHMRAQEIMCPFHYVPLHNAPAGQRYARAAGPLDVTQRISETLVRLPMFFDLGSQVEDVIDVAMTYFEGPKRAIL
ncbi:dTDP-4-amino-4,6-dideoxygalactose transaminase [Minwuia thermotolerans]|uniref:dTDP-4-amino-4,6-dideoxygalactose transaminase n=1 Tax=Minwuia thermotolerans TaxID=2056226 RepID=A0A2M9FVB5_9PROT|nr:dTDP-4-amino-4,6-dideoxygalactose transaminase [Minwuia thermotolerans]PJK27369.1 dTDP-4-amino-4,6-dideoxygalactose transaminase [Minwuia thermotolerans]